MCVENHHTILKASEDLNKHLSKLVAEISDLGLHDGSHGELLLAVQNLQRVARRLERKAQVIARTQP